MWGTRSVAMSRPVAAERPLRRCATCSVVAVSSPGMAVYRRHAAPAGSSGSTAVSSEVRSITGAGSERGKEKKKWVGGGCCRATGAVDTPPAVNIRRCLGRRPQAPPDNGTHTRTLTHGALERRAQLQKGARLVERVVQWEAAAPAGPRARRVELAAPQVQAHVSVRRARAVQRLALRLQGLAARGAAGGPVRGVAREGRQAACGVCRNQRTQRSALQGCTQRARTPGQHRAPLPHTHTHTHLRRQSAAAAESCGTPSRRPAAAACVWLPVAAAAVYLAVAAATASLRGHLPGLAPHAPPRACVAAAGPACAHAAARRASRLSKATNPKTLVVASQSSRATSSGVVVGWSREWFGRIALDLDQNMTRV
jgi:hypothetical protein